MSGIILLAVDFLQSAKKMDGVLERNDYGGGSRMEELEVEVQGEEKKIPVQIEIAEQQYSEEEIQKLFGRMIQKMEEMILGENESLDRIEYDMNLLTKIPDEPIEVSWELDHYDVMNVRGELQPEFIKEEGTQIGRASCRERVLAGG